MDFFEFQGMRGYVWKRLTTEFCRNSPTSKEFGTIWRKIFDFNPYSKEKENILCEDAQYAAVRGEPSDEADSLRWNLGWRIRHPTSERERERSLKLEGGTCVYQIVPPHSHDPPHR
jgi:hypothetical protein